MKMIMSFNKTKMAAKAAPYLGAFGLSFTGASFPVSGAMSSVGVAFAAAFPFPLAAVSVLGALLGYLLRGFRPSLPYLISLIFILCIRAFFQQYPKLKENESALCFAVFLAAFFPLCAKNIAEKGTGIDVVFTLVESMLTASLCYFFKNGIQALESLSKMNVLGDLKKISLCLTAAVWLALLFNLTLLPFTFGRILTVTILLIFSYRMGSREAAFFGICISAVVILCLGGSGELLFILCIGGVLAGLFTPFGRILHGVVFLSVSVAGALLTQPKEEMLFVFCDIFAGILLFLLLPERWLSLLKPVRRLGISELAYNRRMALKLRFTSEAISDMKAAVETISDKLYGAGALGIQSVYDKTIEQVCRKCGLKLFCWETEFSQTNDALQGLTRTFREKGRISSDDLPVYFKEKCAYCEDILVCLNNNYREYLSAESAQRKVKEAKSVAAEQFEGISGMLDRFSEELMEISSIENEKAALIKQFFREIGESVEDVYCINDEFGRMRIELYSRSPLKSDERKMTAQLCEMLERKFSPPTVVTAGKMTKTVFFEQARFSCDFALLQKNAGQNQICGDCCERFADANGFFHIILSDGMGTGGRAAVDSIMTCNFVLKLLKSGFGFDAALKLINSALLVKAGGESLATLDICCVDLYTGSTRFLKAGAVSSFVRHGSHTAMIEGSSLPIGILQGVGYDRHKVTLKSGDMVVMVTDGAVFSSTEALKNEIAALPSLSAGETAKKLMSICSEGSRDDVTVAVMILQENR